MSTSTSHSRRARYAMVLSTGEICDESLASSRVRADRPLLLSRALCRFRRFSAPETLTARQFSRAVMLDAEVHAPFEQSAWMAIRDSAGAEVWYWDMALLETRTGEQEPPLLTAPESVFVEGGDGWRILSVAEGFEAQYWEGGVLRASTWRREAFTEVDWAAFTIGVENVSLEAPAHPPAHVHGDLRADPSRLRRRIKPPLGWRDAERAALIAAVCLATVAAFFSTAGLRHALELRAASQALGQIEQARAEDPALRKLRDDRKSAELYRAVAPNAPVLAAAARAVSTFETAGFEVQRWRIDEKTYSATLKSGDAGLAVRDAAAKLEADPAFRSVAPTFLGGDRGIVIEATVAAERGKRAP